MVGGLAGLLGVVLIVAVAGVAWYFSGVAIAVSHEPERDDVASPQGSGSVALDRSHYALLPGRYGLEWDGGYGTVGPITAVTDTTVVRRFTADHGKLAPGTKVGLDAFAYTGDPRTALGLDFTQVTVPGELGDYPAWLVPAPAGRRTGSTWVVFVHGHGSNRAEGLRYLPMWHAAGLPVLLVSYRNDVDAPASPDGAAHLGDSEWRDVEAAVRWALGHGADDVVLAGWSMGGAVSLQLVDRSELAHSVRGLILDSPVLDWRNVFVYQGADRGLPRPMSLIAAWTVERRTGMDLDRFDWVQRAAALDKPVLLFAGDGDTYVPNGPALELARIRPDLVTLVDEPRADHVRTWNVDPARFETTTLDWLTGIGVLRPA